MPENGVTIENVRPMGSYRWIWAGGRHEQSYTTSPFFGMRKVHLPMANRVALQILVKGLFGQLVWVNADFDDLKFLPLN